MIGAVPEAVNLTPVPHRPQRSPNNCWRAALPGEKTCKLRGPPADMTDCVGRGQV